MARQARSSKQRNGTMPPRRRRPTFLAAWVTDRESNHGGGIIALHDVPVPKPLRRLVAEVNRGMVVSTKMQHIMCFVEGKKMAHRSVVIKVPNGPGRRWLQYLQ